MIYDCMFKKYCTCFCFTLEVNHKIRFFISDFSTKSISLITLRSDSKSREIIKFQILSTVKLFVSMKTWINSSCTLCMKDIYEMFSHLGPRYGKLINACSEVYRAYRHNLIFHRFTRNLWSSQGWILFCFSTYPI